MPPLGGTVVIGEIGTGAPDVLWYATRGGGKPSKGDVGADARLNALDDAWYPGWTLGSIGYPGGY